MPIPESSVLTPEPAEPIDPKMELLQGIANAALSGAIGADEWEALLEENGFEPAEPADTPPAAPKIRRPLPATGKPQKGDLF